MNQTAFISTVPALRVMERLASSPSPSRVQCPKRDDVPGGIPVGHARSIYRPDRDPCKSCGNLMTCSSSS